MYCSFRRLQRHEMQQRFLYLVIRNFKQFVHVTVIVRKIGNQHKRFNKCYPKPNSVCKSIMILCLTFPGCQRNKIHQRTYFVSLKSFWQYVILLLVSSWKYETFIKIYARLFNSCFMHSYVICTHEIYYFLHIMNHNHAKLENFYNWYMLLKHLIHPHLCSDLHIISSAIYIILSLKFYRLQRHKIHQSFLYEHIQKFP